MPLKIVDEYDNTDKHAEGKRLPKFSIFSFIVNTNKAPRDVDQRDEISRKFSKWLRRVFNDRNVAENVLINSSGNPLEIEQIDTFIGNEIGGKMHRIHANVVIRVRHHNNFTIDVDYLYEVWKSDSGFDKLCNISNPKSAYDKSAYLLWYAHMSQQRKNEIA